MAYSRKRPSLDPCPVETVLAIISGKWKVRVLISFRWMVLRLEK